MKQIVMTFAACVLAAGLRRGVPPADSTGDGLAVAIDHRVQQAVKPLLAQEKGARVADFESLALSQSWTEAWPDGRGGQTTVPVQGKIWNSAIAASLTKHGAAYLPKREEPYYLDGPIVLMTGQRLSADRDAEIRLKPSRRAPAWCETSTCHRWSQGARTGSVKPEHQYRHRRRHLDDP